MAIVHVNLPKPEIKGIGHVLYRCAECGELMEPEAAVIVADLSYHPDHQPENDPNGL
jgi:predicted N-acetyltransferase YhbS